jgi:hypothetical protein
MPEEATFDLPTVIEKASDIPSRAQRVDRVHDVKHIVSVAATTK